MSKKVILLIDDDELFLMLSRRLLEKQPFLERIDTLSRATEVEQYFEKLMEQGKAFPDAIFIDLDMPQTHGLALAQHIKENYLAENASATKLFILSSSISQRDRQTAESLEAVKDYMEKPLTAEILKQALGLEDRPPVKGRGTTGSKEQQKA